jgi:hypothetical protein
MSQVEFTQATKFAQLAEQDKYWKTWPTRWEYISVVQAWLQWIEPQTVLEAGCSGGPVCTNSDTLGLSDATFIHDLTETPWPFDDKQYDVFLALQVWEHLGDKQRQAFEEAERVANHTILSLPYLWNRPGNCHHGIDETTIRKWAGGRDPSKTFITNGTTSFKRIICYWTNQ